MQAPRERVGELFELFLPDEPPEEVLNGQVSDLLSFDAMPPEDPSAATRAPDPNDAERPFKQLRHLPPRTAHRGTERGSFGKSNSERPGKKEDLTLRPLVRDRAPCQGEAPLSTIIVDDDARFGYRVGWVFAALKITNRSQRDLRFTCRGIRLKWDRVATDLVPADLNEWTVEAQGRSKVTTLAPIMVSRRALGQASTSADVRLDLLCDTTKQTFPLDIREAVWRSHLRPAFFDERSVVLVCPPNAKTRKGERECVPAQCRPAPRAAATSS